MIEPKSYGFDSPERPTPEYAIQFKKVPLFVDGKPNPNLKWTLFSLPDFMKMVEKYAVMNCDGTGFYAYVTNDNVMESNQYAKPDAMREGAVDWYWTHVMWFNK
jgi:hypothetical protein